MTSTISIQYRALISDERYIFGDNQVQQEEGIETAGRVLFQILLSIKRSLSSILSR